MKKAGSLIAGKRWSFFHGPDLDPLTSAVLLGHPGPVQMCRLLSAPPQCTLQDSKRVCRSPVITSSPLFF